MSEANWEIKVGGEYRSSTAGLLTRVVTAMDGDDVFFEYLLEDGKRVTPSTPRVSKIVFRFISLPEDQSPIPDMLEALKRVECFLKTQDIDEGEDMLSDETTFDLIRRNLLGVRAAIAKAEAGVSA